MKNQVLFSEQKKKKKKKKKIRQFCTTVSGLSVILLLLKAYIRNNHENFIGSFCGTVQYTIDKYNSKKVALGNNKHLKQLKSETWFY